MGEPQIRPRRARAGGRAARVAARAAPLPVDIKPIRPGMEAGTYRPLTDAQVARVHAQALEALETIGLSDAPPSGVELLTGVGAIQGEDGRIRFPRALVEDMLAVANKDLTLYGRDPEFDLPIRPGCVHFGTAGAAVNFVDVAEGGYRDATIADLYEAACITQALDNMHFFQRVLVARDILDMQELDLNTLYASIAGTVKHVGTAFSDPSCVADCFELLHMVAGSEAAWRMHPRHLCIGQRPVGARLHAGPDGLDIDRQGRGPCSHPRRAPTGTGPSRPDLWFTHVPLPPPRVD